MTSPAVMSCLDELTAEIAATDHVVAVEPTPLSPDGQTGAVQVCFDLATEGRAVVFAGSTVVVSLLGLLTMGRDYLWGVTAATSLAVLMVVFASVTVGPGRQEPPELDDEAAGPFECGPEGFGVPPPAAHQPGQGEDHPQLGVPLQPTGPDSEGARAHGLDGTKTQVAALPPG